MQTPPSSEEFSRWKSSNGVQSDERVEQLLRIFSELEAHETTMSQDQFSEMLRHAALACGFLTSAEACESLIGPIHWATEKQSALS